MKTTLPYYSFGRCFQAFFFLFFLTTMGIAQYDANFELRINVGGPLLNYQGIEFSADQYATNGSTYTNSQALVDDLYKTERYGTGSRQLNFDIPMENGDYEIILHFAEIYHGATGGGPGGTGKRIFDISLEGNLEEDNFDIFSEAGAETPLLKTYNVTVSDASLSILLSGAAADGGVDYPKISAIEVLGIDNSNGGTSPWVQNGNNISYIAGKVGIGIQDPGIYALAVDGTIHTKEVKVDMIGWADYVFENDYLLPSLAEVEQHILENGHLINVPSAEEVEANGIELGEMNKRLLEKIEELTLYIIQQDKNHKQLETRIKLLKTKK
ncbi:malectin [Pricia sp.]|uniref:malectin n=1 Tax=Pricia sp. TaxID=2268138 RepID=UPI0035949120